MNKKLVPDPPIDTTISDPETSRDEDLLRDRDAIKRALDYYLDPPAHYTEKPRRPSTMFMIAPNNDTESLLVNACESLASASVMASDFATDLIGPQRHKAMAIQQIIMLAELAVNRAVDNVVPT
ncbi:DUF6124 family protein [Pseudomonas sp. B21-040]|jgi:hypothetical protein|uniref:DUF6124 family protein n=1 Tax=unclassified Pseudomonas TaxID=196821 RepID=UPI000D6C33CB|nr:MULTISPECIES: DUF6124 family protein [unclassified Pseudomonas]PWK44043.1 hypothetical protein C7534_103430 [Pseudomonas sp. OV226]UVL41077.1 DUF6124 family protein [Pseudomonas sp. B21-040]